MEETPNINISSEPVPLRQALLGSLDLIGNPQAIYDSEVAHFAQVQTHIKAEIGNAALSAEEAERLKSNLQEAQVRLQVLRNELGLSFGGPSS